MKIFVNGQETDIQDEYTLSDLAVFLELPQQGVAVAVNNRMVPRTQWHTHMLNEGDNLVIIKAACGG